MTHWRVALHALDRTGPPMLAAALLGWISHHRPADTVDVVAVRGGSLRDAITDLPAVSEVRVLLDPHAAGMPAGGPELARLRDEVGDLPRAAATLLVSVAAGQTLPVLPETPLLTWSVEAGDDLHWIDGIAELRDRTTRWCAGSEVTRGDLAELLPGVEVGLLPEFVDPDEPPTPELRAARRATLDPSGKGTVVVGAGIATYRKAPDLFVELALADRRRWGDRAAFTWIGGDEDHLAARLHEQVRRLGDGLVRFVPSVPDLPTWLAAADVLLHPARLDSFPLVCLHAALAGTPVVAFDGSGVAEMFGPAFRGAAYPDLREMGGSLHALLADPAERAAVAAVQRERASPHTTPVAAPAVVDELVALADGGLVA